mmetsp:Transcript_19359/g.58234  ORF Transcript_19359/g.58234 Transcript_19359/m.58234 type:complete len:907 (-) Transcript_19359:36-2756(-)
MATAAAANATANSTDFQATVWWLAAVSALGILVIFLSRSLRLQKLDQGIGHAQLQYGVSLRSAFIYVAMAVPPLLLRCTEEEAGQVTLHSWGACTASPYGILPTNLMRVYHWLPFWFASLVGTHFAVCISGAWDAIRGSALAILALSFLNCLAPGGAGGLRQGTPDAKLGWLPGGYSSLAVLLFVVSFVYAMFLCRMSVGAKQYALGAFGTGVLQFMNPETTRGFRAVLFDWNLEWNWNGPMMCEVWLMLIAIVLSFVSLGLVPCTRHSWERHTCIGSASKALSELSVDTTGCLEWLVTSFCRDSQSFDADSSDYYVRQLGSRRTTVEGLLTQAPWECFGNGSRKRLRRLTRFADLLRNLRQALRVELQQARAMLRSGPGPLASDKVQALLDEYLASCRTALAGVTCVCCGDRPLKEAFAEALAATAHADDVLAEVLGHLQATGPIADEEAFIDRLRSWPAFVKNAAMALQEEEESCPVAPLPSTAAPHPGGSTLMGQLGFVQRNGLSWMLAFLWSLYVRGFQGGCVVTVSFIFSTKSGSSFDKNINRMVGVGLGLGVGSVPALLVMQGAALDGGQSEVFLQGLTIYIVVMFIMWTMAMYGYLAPGSKYSYACLLWVAHSGTQMLRHVPKYDRARGLFLDVIDNMLACLIVFVVDMLWAYVSGASTSEQARAAVVRCVEDAAAVAEALEDAKGGDMADIDVVELQEHIKTARLWHGEIRREGLVWTDLWEAPYKADIARALLDHCDEVSVAAFAIQASARRCASPQHAAKLAGCALGSGFGARCREHVRSTGAVLDGSLGAEALRKMMARPPPEEDPTPANGLATAEGTAPGERAAALAVWISAAALRTALQRISRLLAARAALDSRDWRAAERPMQGPSSLAPHSCSEAPPPRLESSPAELRRRH